jgi:hypothetical protein
MATSEQQTERHPSELKTGGTVKFRKTKRREVKCDVKRKRNANTNASVLWLARARQGCLSLLGLLSAQRACDD